MRTLSIRSKILLVSITPILAVVGVLLTQTISGQRQVGPNGSRTPARC